MGWRFRKRVKILPGIAVNITGKGVSSVSVGGKGLTANLGMKGTRVTASLPGTGISWSEKVGGKTPSNSHHHYEAESSGGPGFAAQVLTIMLLAAPVLAFFFLFAFVVYIVALAPA